MTESGGSPNAQPGWYPGQDGQMHWWDGTRWTAAAPSNQQLESQRWQQDKTLAMLAHLSPIVAGFIGPLVVYLIVKDDPTKSQWLRHHAAEALNFSLSMLIYGTVVFVVGFFLSIVTLGLFFIIWIPLLMALGLAALILSILASVKANNGEWHSYPLTARFVTP